MKTLEVLFAVLIIAIAIVLAVAATGNVGRSMVRTAAEHIERAAKLTDAIADQQSDFDQRVGDAEARIDELERLLRQPESTADGQ